MHATEIQRVEPVVLTLAKIASVCEGQLIGHSVDCQGMAIDSRKVIPGNVFVAIKGEFVDGHDYLAAAKAKGAVAAIVTKACDINLPQIVVQNQQDALKRLATYWRTVHPLPVIGITGSCGKTSVKEMIAQILAVEHKVYYTHGNLNNELGVPLSLLSISDEDFAVIEMGASRIGDIAYLCDMAKPNVGIITCIAPVHLEGFHDIESVLMGKTELFRSLSLDIDQDGIAIVNIDDPLLRKMADTINAQIISYGIVDGDCFVRHYKESTEGSGCIEALVSTPIGDFDLKLNLLGRHNLLNAVGAAAAAVACGISLENIAHGLSLVKPVGGRLVKQKTPQGFMVIDDTYNANPVAFKAAIDVLKTNAESDNTLVVMGDMGELGPDAAAYHAMVGTYAKEKGISRFFGVGALTAEAVKAFGENGRHFPNQEALNLALLNLENNDPQFSDKLTILIKGSRSAGMEKVVAALLKGI